ncbi:hypothetical protein Pan110_25180 [Gimesia panareensis]|nr:hypothetical protein Pan110_25180 [Gimesia panareensis]
MKQRFHLRRTVNQFLCGLFVLLLSPYLAAQQTAPAPREKIGEDEPDLKQFNIAQAPCFMTG